jgi:prophage regulatory protein
MSGKQISLLPLRSVLNRTGRKRSGHYVDIQRGIFPPPIKISARSVRWPDNEVDALVEARIAGKSESELQSLVKRLVAARSAGGAA